MQKRKQTEFRIQELFRTKVEKLHVKSKGCNNSSNSLNDEKDFVI